MNPAVDMLIIVVVAAAAAASDQQEVLFSFWLLYGRHMLLMFDEEDAIHNLLIFKPFLSANKFQFKFFIF